MISPLPHGVGTARARWRTFTTRLCARAMTSATTPSVVDAPAGPARPTGAHFADTPPSVTPAPLTAAGLTAFRGGDDRYRGAS